MDFTKKCINEFRNKWIGKKYIFSERAVPPIELLMKEFVVISSAQIEVLLFFSFNQFFSQKKPLQQLWFDLQKLILTLHLIFYFFFFNKEFDTISKH